MELIVRQRIGVVPALGLRVALRSSRSSISARAVIILPINGGRACAVIMLHRCAAMTCGLISHAP